MPAAFALLTLVVMLFPAGVGAAATHSHASSPLPHQISTSSEIQGTPARGAVHPAKSPGCGRSPCPMGVVDYGIYRNLTTYSYTTNYVESFVDVNYLSTANKTPCFDPNAQYCMAFQSNWWATDVVVHGIPTQHWVQNLAEVGYDASCSSPCVSKRFSVTWWDNVWNLTSSGKCNPATGFNCMNSGDFLGNQTGGCLRTNWNGTSKAIWGCTSATVWGLRTPFTIQNLLHVGITSGILGNLPTLKVYGAVYENGQLKSGAYYDELAFIPGSSGSGHPVFTVDGAKKTPVGLSYDGEWTLGGWANGATITLGKTNLLMETYISLKGTWTTPRAAWSSGRDTAETVSAAYVSAYAGTRTAASLAFGTADDPQTCLW
jgi:hypothetical protein